MTNRRKFLGLVLATGLLASTDPIEYARRYWAGVGPGGWSASATNALIPSGVRIDQIAEAIHYRGVPHGEIQLDWHERVPRSTDKRQLYRAANMGYVNINFLMPRASRQFYATQPLGDPDA